MRTRNVMFTLWNPEMVEEKEAGANVRAWMRERADMDMSAEVKFMVCQLEKAPDTGRIHVQGYLELTKPLTYDKIKEILGWPSAHLEPRRGSQKQAIDYVTKVCISLSLSLSPSLATSRSLSLSLSTLLYQFPSLLPTVTVFYYGPEDTDNNWGESDTEVDDYSDAEF